MVKEKYATNFCDSGPKLVPVKVYLASDYAALEARCRELEASKDAAYLERNKLVALLATLYPSGLKRTAIEGWSEDWHGCVYIDFPWGQASWHYHDSQAHLFDGLPPYAGTWDGHSTEVKYNSIQYATRLRIGLQKTQKNPFAPRGRGMPTPPETRQKLEQPYTVNQNASTMETPAEPNPHSPACDTQRFGRSECDCGAEDWTEGRMCRVVDCPNICAPRSTACVDHTANRGGVK